MDPLLVQVLIFVSGVAIGLMIWGITVLVTKKKDNSETITVNKMSLKEGLKTVVEKFAAMGLMKLAREKKETLSAVSSNVVNAVAKIPAPFADITQTEVDEANKSLRASKEITVDKKLDQTKLKLEDAKKAVATKVIEDETIKYIEKKLKDKCLDETKKVLKDRTDKIEAKGTANEGVMIELSLDALTKAHEQATSEFTASKPTWTDIEAAVKTAMEASDIRKQIIYKAVTLAA